MKVILVILVCVVGADSQIDVFDQLKVMVEKVWDSFKEFIKRPPRSHMKRGNVQKNTQEVNEPVDFIIRSKATSTKAEIEVTTVQNIMPPGIMYYFQRPRHKPVLLPVFPRPKWQALDGYSWYDDEQPDRFTFRKYKRPTSRKTTFASSMDSGDETTRRMSDEPAEDIGVMMFV